MPTVTWTGAGDGLNWTTALNWSPTGEPSGADTVLIDPTTYFQIGGPPGGTIAAASIFFDPSGSHLALFTLQTATLDLGGALALEAGTFEPNGTVVGGTIVMGGGTMEALGGTLDDVTVQGVLGGTTFVGGTLAVETGLQLLNGSGGGTIDPATGTLVLNFLGSQTFDNATVLVGGYSTISTTGTLIFGPALTLDIDLLTGGTTFATSSGAEIINDGTVAITVGSITAGYSVPAPPLPAVNNGLITLSGSTDTARLGPATVFSNTGTLQIGANQTLTSTSSLYNNGGLITLAGAAAALTLFSPGSSATGIAHGNAGGTIDLGGGTTLNVDGTLQGGTLLAAPDSALFADGNTFDAVSVLGTLDLTGESDLTAGAGTTFGGASAGIGGAIVFDRGELVLANGQSRYDGTLLFDSSVNSLFVNQPFTLAPSAVVAAATPTLASINVTGGFTNQGTIDTATGETLAITAGSFVNTGALTLVAGSTLVLTTYLTVADFNAITYAGGSVVLGGTLDGEGATIDAVTGSTFANTTLTGTVENATLLTSPSGIDLNTGTLDGVTLGGMINVANDSNLSIGGGLTGIGTINLAASQSDLTFVNSETIENVTINAIGTVGIAAASPPAVISVAESFSAFDLDVLQRILDDLGITPETLWDILEAPGPIAFGTAIALDNITLGIQGASGSNSGSIHDPGGNAYLKISLTSFVNSGSILAAASDAFLISSSTFTNSGTLAAVGGLIGVAQALTGSGTALVGDGGGLALEASVAATQTIDFQAGGGELQLFRPLAVAAEIDGFSSGDSIDLALTNVSTIVASPGTLVAYNGATAVARLAIAGSYTSADYSFGPDGNSGTVIGVVACFAEGTRILTATGERAVETLRIGDLLPDLIAQRLRRIVWLGHKTIGCAVHPRPADVLPVRVRKGAFGPDRPHRDLILSPDHALWCSGALIPVRALINGHVIAQLSADTITYWHIELERHGVLLAEGICAESYLDVGDRGAFTGGSPPAPALFVTARREARACAFLATS